VSRNGGDTIIVFLDIIHHPFSLFKTKRFGDWILSPSSGKNLLIWAQSVELVPISGDGDRIQSRKQCVLNKIKQHNG
jgi:hypothetical protein